MKYKVISVFALVFMSNICFGQLGGFTKNVKNKINNKINSKINSKVDNAIDNTINDADGAIKNGANADSKNKSSNSSSQSGGKSGNENTGTSLTVSSKFDFVPGEKVVAYEDFEQDAIGDFPDKWNTNGSGEIVTTNKSSGKYLMTRKEVVFSPTWIKSLPENLTLEFDLMCSNGFSFYSGDFVTGFTSATNVGADFRSFGKSLGEGKISNGGGFEIRIHPTNAASSQGKSEFFNSKNGERIIFNDVEQNKFTTNGSKTKAHVSIWRQKQRVRVYINDLKIWDLPQAVPEGIKLNSIYFRNSGAWERREDDAFYFGNMKLAVGAPDTRNKLISEGKFVTNGILFDVNSATIKAESYGVIKDIANVLSENTNVNVKIVGHTDSDGDANANMVLSKKRAEAVKQYLISNFKIDANRLTTDGKGASQPIDKNNTAVAKANNRRVEFVKL